MHGYALLCTKGNGRLGKLLINIDKIFHYRSENPRVGSSILSLATI